MTEIVIHNPANMYELHAIMIDIAEESAYAAQNITLQELQNQNNTHEGISLKVRDAVLDVHRRHKFKMEDTPEELSNALLKLKEAHANVIQIYQHLGITE